MFISISTSSSSSSSSSSFCFMICFLACTFRYIYFWCVCGTKSWKRSKETDTAQQPPRFITPKQAQVTPLIEKYYPSKSGEKTPQYWVWNPFSRALGYLQHARSQKFSSKQASESTSLYSAITTSSFLFVFSRILLKYLLFIILSHLYKIICKTPSRYIKKPR
jgi:hypothetical protein